MKHLKYINESKYNEYYFEISALDLRKEIESSSLESFTKDEILQVERIMPQYMIILSARPPVNTEITRDMTKADSSIQLISKQSNRNVYRLMFVITKVKDEWFYVKVYDVTRKFQEISRIYKCDQFEGLKMLLDIL